MKKNVVLSVLTCVIGLSAFALLVYKQAYPTVQQGELPNVMQGMRRTDTHWEKTVTGVVQGYVIDDPNPPPGALSDSFIMQTDRADNAGYPITGSLIELRALEGHSVRMTILFPLQYDGGAERPFKDAHVINPHP